MPSPLRVRPQQIHEGIDNAQESERPTLYDVSPPASRYKNYCESQLPSARSGPSPLRSFVHQSFGRGHWRDQLLSEEWSQAVDLATRIIVSPSCQVHEVDSHRVVLRTRRLSFRFSLDVGGTSFWALSGLGRFVLLSSTISNGVHKRIRRVDKPVAYHRKPSAEPSGQITVRCINASGHTHCLPLTGGHR